MASSTRTLGRPVVFGASAVLLAVAGWLIHRDAMTPRQAFARSAGGSTLQSLSLGTDLGPVVDDQRPAAQAGVDPGQTMSFQGILRNPDETLVNGPRDLTFRICDQPVQGTVLHVETIEGVEVRDGMFQVVLGAGDKAFSAAASNLFANENRYVEIQIKGDAPMVPRLRFHAVPWALNLVPGASIKGDAGTGASLSAENTGVGHGVFGASTKGWGGFFVGRSTDAGGVVGIADSNSNAGVYGNNIGTGPGVVGRSVGTGAAVEGHTNGTGAAVLGHADGTGPAILGRSGDGNAVQGVAGPPTRGPAGTTGYGVVGDSSINDGVYGYSTALNMSGVVGSSTKGPGIRGYSATDVGIVAWSDAKEAIRAVSLGLRGIHAEARDSDGASAYAVEGVLGRSIGRLGADFALPVTLPGGQYPRAGVYGEGRGRDGSAVLFAGYFKGAVIVEDNMSVGGDLSVTGGISMANAQTVLDHPSAPRDKLLVQSTVSSPDRITVFSGNVTSDASGSAEVMLPSYVDDLSTDFRYQLTVIGQFAQAIIAQKVKDNRFIIMTSEPNVEVSWQVTGVRNDPWARANPMVNEQAKEGAARGHYLHPEAFGEPASEAMMAGPQLDSDALHAPSSEQAPVAPSLR